MNSALRVAFIVAACLESILASAADFSTPISDLDGKPVTNCHDAKGCSEAPILTLGDVCWRSLVAEYGDEQPDPKLGRPGISGEEKFRRVELAIKIKGAKTLNLKSEETTLVKILVAKAWSPIVVHSAWLLLEPSLKTDPSK